jgi:hypothetical protein
MTISLPWGCQRELFTSDPEGLTKRGQHKKKCLTKYEIRQAQEQLKRNPFHHPKEEEGAFTLFFLQKLG